ncbi:hypothetical protein BraRD5C2_29950 [Bradyrhizobium sp. RD5-C2]|nr:hypothetical protein BraRD5C2_29950 [Bradyrhizobium sp. RD5-C2]
MGCAGSGAVSDAELHLESRFVFSIAELYVDPHADTDTDCYTVANADTHACPHADTNAQSVADTDHRRAVERQFDQQPR